jgi:ABC-type proline/glycine betaine transport system permease subunit
MRITVVGVLGVIVGIVLLAIVLDRLSSSLNQGKKAPEEKAKNDDQPNRPEN